MSVENIRKIERKFLARVPEIRTVEDGLALYGEQVAALARQSAEHLFLKVTTEPGWTPPEAKRLADSLMHEHANGIITTLLMFGIPADTAGDIVEISVNAFGQRWNELTAAPSTGGAA